MNFVTEPSSKAIGFENEQSFESPARGSNDPREMSNGSGLSPLRISMNHSQIIDNEDSPTRRFAAVDV